MLSCVTLCCSCVPRPSIWYAHSSSPPYCAAVVHACLHNKVIGCSHPRPTGRSQVALWAASVQEDDYGRARVHTQWGDDAELIEEAVQMCPVDCIAYVRPSSWRSRTPACLLVPVLVPYQLMYVWFRASMTLEQPASGGWAVLLFGGAQAGLRRLRRGSAPCTGEEG